MQMADTIFLRYELSLTNNPTLLFCNRCQQAFTRFASYPHMTTHADFNEQLDLFMLSLERCQVVRTFNCPTDLLPPIPGIPIAVGKMCGAFGCREIFVDPDDMSHHARTRHRKEVSVEEPLCGFQEVHAEDSIVRFAVLCDDFLQAEGD
jgi:hypothetical protein